MANTVEAFGYLALPRNLGRVVADTREVIDNKEKKELNMEIMKRKRSAVETIKTRRGRPR